MVRYLFYTIGDLTYQSPLVIIIIIIRIIIIIIITRHLLLSIVTRGKICMRLE